MAEPSDRRRKHPLRPAALLLPAVLAVLGATGPPPAAGSDPIASGLSDLHQGLYGRAEEGLQAAARARPGDPDPPMFLAYSHWWRSLQGEEDPGQEAARDAAIEAALGVAERRLEASPDDTRAMGAAGTVRILRGHLAARDRRYREAAQDAKRGRKLLEAVLEKDPSHKDALFALGAYNYYFDQIPAVVKGLRALLFLPGGDSERGLRQLREVAASRGRFRTDARLLLALICGSRQERCYADALAHLAMALDENPGSPVILASIGALHLRLGDGDAALPPLRNALDAASGPGPDRARQRRRIRLLIAEALAAGWRLDEAGEALRAAAGEPGPEGEGEWEAAERIGRELALKRGETEGAGGLAGIFREALAAVHEGRTEEALGLLRRAAATAPGSPLPRFLAGRTLCLAGRFREAVAELRAAAGLMQDPPPWLSGWTEIYLGQAEAGMGNRRSARGHFQRAGQVRRFRAADRAFLELQAGAPPDRRCAAP